MTDEELATCAAPDLELEAELNAMEAANPHLKAVGDRLRDLEAHLTGQHSQFGVHLNSLRRMRKARMKWRSPAPTEETP